MSWRRPHDSPSRLLRTKASEVPEIALKEVPEIALEETTQKNRVLLIGNTIGAQNGEISCRNRHTSVGPEGVVMLKAVVIVAVVVMIVVIVVIQSDGPYVKWQETIECGGPG